MLTLRHVLFGVPMAIIPWLLFNFIQAYFRNIMECLNCTFIGYKIERRSGFQKSGLLIGRISIGSLGNFQLSKMLVQVYETNQKGVLLEFGSK